MILIVTFHSRWTVTMIKTNKLQLLRQFWPLYLNGVLADIIQNFLYFFIQSLLTLVEIPLGGPQQVMVTVRCPYKERVWIFLATTVLKQEQIGKAINKRIKENRYESEPSCPLSSRLAGHVIKGH